MPSLLRLLTTRRLAQQALRHTSYGTSGRAITGTPEPSPVPKHVFQYHYVFDYYPEALGAFHVYSLKRDQFVLEHFFMLENYDYKYEGEQWHIGSFFWNVFWFLFPTMLFIGMSYENWDNTRRKAPRNVNFSRGAVPLQAIVALDYDPPVDEDRD